ncbi:MAG: hypothetical protein M1400_01290 [Patescibacteria group bacterium]|nr:hypothetical protein [Patescibacteria group bacterium]
MQFSDLVTYFWLALGLLALGSVYLIVDGYRVHKIFADSIVGRLVKILVTVFIIEMYSLGVVSFAFVFLNPKNAIILLPIAVLWLVSLGIAIYGVRAAKKDMDKLIR